jgi:hypothetical protein
LIIVNGHFIKVSIVTVVVTLFYSILQPTVYFYFLNKIASDSCAVKILTQVLNLDQYITSYSSVSLAILIVSFVIEESRFSVCASVFLTEEQLNNVVKKNKQDVVYIFHNKRLNIKSTKLNSCKLAFNIIKPVIFEKQLVKLKFYYFLKIKGF